MTKPYDQAFKFLAERDPKGLLLLLGEIQPEQEATVELLPREVSVSAQLPDQPYQVTYGDATWMVHVESQTVYDYGLPDRMMEYAVRLWLKYRLPINSYALVLTSRKQPKDPVEPVLVSAGHLNIALKYQQVCLWTISAEDALKLNRDSLLPFVPLMRGGLNELEASARRLAATGEESRKQELSLHFLLLGGLRYNPQELLDLIGRETMIPLEQLKESSFYQYIMNEGRVEGRVEGREAGREEGRAEALSSLLLRMIENRFGRPSDETIQRIKAADADTLDGWAIRVSDGSSLEDLFGD